MEETDTAICLKKRNKKEENIKKITTRLKSLNLIINKIVFNYYLIKYAMFFSHTLLNP